MIDALTAAVNQAVASGWNIQASKFGNVNQQRVA